ncbi:MAG: hypothetical protein IKV94_06005 [Clostridia bacterium]|nr:hypothetical protein [Clostridia bacterium]
MKTNKKAISLIVLVITIVVLSILASTVIISLSNINIIEQARVAAFKSDMANYKQAYNLYLAEKALDKDFNKASLNIDATTNNAELYEELFGDKYAGKLKVENGQLLYVTDETDDELTKSVVAEMGMAKIQLEIGDYVIYTPDPTNTTEKHSVVYEGEKEGVESFSSGSNSYLVYTAVEPLIQENFKWIYIGTVGGKMLLVADTSSSEQILVSDYIGSSSENFEKYEVIGADQLDTLCNELYSSDIAAARSMDKEDADRLLANDATKDIVHIVNGSNIPGYFLATVGEKSYDGACEIVTMYSASVLWDGSRYVSETPLTGGNNWCYDNNDDSEWYGDPSECGDDSELCYCYCGGEGNVGALGHYRPVIVLNSNVEVDEKTADGWTLKVIE